MGLQGILDDSINKSCEAGSNYYESQKDGSGNYKIEGEKKQFPLFGVRASRVAIEEQEFIAHMNLK